MMILEQFNKLLYGILLITEKKNGKYDKTSDDETWLYYTLDGNTYTFF